MIRDNRRPFVLYKQLLKAAKQIPNKTERNQNLNEIRETFRKHLTPALLGSEQGEADFQKLVDLADSKLSYLKIVTPRETGMTPKKKKFIFKDGEKIEGTSIVDKKAYKSGLDPDDLARHQYLLERQHFMHRK
eukprot:snap_masked-scaffold_12-processed-gene-12.28-mRNA-1 protein AED:0.42 eAED:0.46 QI:0/-1/0/1/-1/1/1/0/132